MNKSPEIPCSSCATHYPVLPGGVPVLLAPEQRKRFTAVLQGDPGGRRMAQEYRRFGTWRASIVYDEDVAWKYSWIYDTQGPETMVLSIGCGPGRENPRGINLNIDAFDSVDIVGDGTNLPLMNASIDTVTCNAVIEHVPDPYRLVAEDCPRAQPRGDTLSLWSASFSFSRGDHTKSLLGPRHLRHLLRAVTHNMKSLSLFGE